MVLVATGQQFLAAVVHSDDLPVLAPQSRLRGHSVVVCSLNISFKVTQLSHINLVFFCFDKILR